MRLRDVPVAETTESGHIDSSVDDRFVSLDDNNETAAISITTNSRHELAAIIDSNKG
jgi:hypothetical protein